MESHNETPPVSSILLLGMAVAIGPLAIDLYLPALPLIAESMQTSIDRVQQTLAVFMIGFALCQLVYGPLSDRFGRKPVLLSGIFLYSIISIVCTTATTVEMLQFMRLLQALGGGAAAVVVVAIVRDHYTGRDAARVMSLVMMVMVMTPLIAPLMGGWFLLLWSWQSLFWFMGLFGVLIFIWAWLKLDETLLVEQRQQISIRRMMQNSKEIFTHRESMGYVLSSSFAFGAMFAFIAGSPFVYIDYYGVSPEHYGLLFGANVIMTIALNWINSRKVKKIGINPLVSIGLRIQIIATALLFLVALTGFGGLWSIVVLVIFCTGVVGLLAANTMAAALTPFGAFAGYASALFGTMRFIIAALAISSVSILHNGTPIPMTAVMFSCSLLASVIFIVLVKPGHQN